MVLYQRTLLVFIGSEEPGIGYGVYWVGQGLGNVGFALVFIQKRETFLRRVYNVSGAHPTPYPIDSQRTLFVFIGSEEPGIGYWV